MIYHGTIRKTSPKRPILPENGVDSKNDKTSKPMVFWGSRKTTPAIKQVQNSSIGNFQPGNESNETLFM